MGKVHFIDTTVLAELLNIPGLSTRHDQINAEYLQLDENEDVFVLPIAVLVETGNHIAHIPNGNQRYQIANKFADLVKNAADGKNRWNVVPEIPIEVLEAILSQLPTQACQGTGFGDVSIVEQFNDYWKNRQPIGEMRIWSLDKHLSGYSRTGGLSRRKDR